MSAYAGKTVREILAGKLGRIKNAALDPGSPSWDDILDLTWEELDKAAQQGNTGFRTFRKLLQQKGYNK